MAFEKQKKGGNYTAFPEKARKKGKYVNSLFFFISFVYNDKKRGVEMKKKKLFFALSSALSTLFFLWFLALSAHLIAQNIKQSLFFLFLSAIAFFLVSVLRRLIGAKRPYQNGVTTALRHGKDDSFPSRHAYSCFFITAVTFFFFPIAAIPLLVLSLLLCVFRVLSGTHYVLDVLAGGLLGISFALVTSLFI